MIYASIFGLICFCSLSVAGKSKYRTISNYQMTNGHPECHYCKSPNVRTVLFKSSSISNICWNAEDLALLLARAVMQDILPRKMPQNIPLLLEYIKECLEILKKEAKNNRVRVLMATAMMDTLGGYLESYGLPIIRRIYYEGNVDYDTVNEFYKLQNEFKMILITDGGGWSKPMTINHKFTSVIPLKLPKAKENSCKKIITTSDYNNYNKDISQSAYTGNQFLIPMPMFDDYENPRAVGVPIRGKCLYSLDSRSAFDVLLIYYTQCIQCLEYLTKKRLLCTDKTNNPINYFEYHYFNWLVKNVLPRLSDEKWYPGFSNVLRILATIKEKGIPVDNEMKFKFLRHLKHTEPVILEDEIPEKLKRDHYVKQKKLGLRLPPIALLAFLLSITCVCCLFIKLYCLCNENRKKSRNDETSTLKTTGSSTSYPETFSSCGIKH